MKTRDELDRMSGDLRARVARQGSADVEAEALALRASGNSIVETAVVVTQGIDISLHDAQELLVRLAASGSDRYQ